MLNSQGNVFLQAATYDFDLPLMVNGVKWPISSPPSFSPLSSSSTSSRLSAGSTKHMVRLLSHSVTMATQRPRRIQATGGITKIELEFVVCN